MRTVIAIAAAALLLLAALPAGAEPGVTITSAEGNGSTATVAGTATFEVADGPIDVGGSIAGFANADAAKALGISLTGAEIEILDDGLRFIWHVEDLPEQVPPEGIRYTWSFVAADRSYQLQAKSSNLASVTTTEDPVGHAQQAASAEPWFQLRGACQGSYQGTGVAGCYHLAFLEGEFDAANDTVTMEMPFDTRDSIGRLVGEGFSRGVAVTANETAGASLTAALQAVVSTTATGSFLNGWDTVYTGPSVAAFAGKSGQKAPPFGAEWQPLDLDEATGAFSGTVTGLSAANDTVVVRACNVTTCTFAEVAP